MQYLKNRPLRHRNNILNLNENYNEQLFFQTVFEKCCIKTMFLFHLNFNVQLGSKKVFNKFLIAVISTKVNEEDEFMR